MKSFKRGEHFLKFLDSVMEWGGTRKARCKSLTFAFKNRF